MSKTIFYKQLERLFFAATLAGTSFVVGILGFMFIEKFNFIDALFMTVITISTVGFEEVHQLSDVGKVFTAVYILLNLAIVAYVISTLTTFLFEGEIKKIIKTYSIIKKVEKFNNHVIVCGYGRNGRKVCEELTREKRLFVVVDNDAQRHLMQTSFEMIFGDATLDETLQKAGILKASTIITTLPKDADNVFITLTAREMNPNVKIIARSSEENSEKKLYRAGADKVVMPDRLGGLHMAQLITKPHVIEFIDLLSGLGEVKLCLEEVPFEKLKPHFRNKTLKDLQIRQHSEATVIAFKDDAKGFTFNPNPDIVVGESDVIILLGTEKAIADFKEQFC